MLSIVLLFFLASIPTAIKLYFNQKKSDKKNTATNESDNKGDDL